MSLGLFCSVSSRFKYEPNGEISDLSAPPSLLRSVHQILQVTGLKVSWMKVFRIIPEFRILRLTFSGKSASKS